MQKGKFGVRIAFYGVAAFILALLGQSLALVLLAGVVLIGEKNEWAFKQVLQALFVCFIVSIIRTVLGTIDFIGKIPVLGSIWSGFLSVVYSILNLIILVFSLIGISKTAKGLDANIPVAKKFADWAFEKVPEAVAAQPTTGAEEHNQ